jgi:flagellar biosynthesis protein FlhA
MVFLTAGTGAAGLGFMLIQKEKTSPKKPRFRRPKQKADAPKELDWDDVDQVDLIGLEIGYGLIPLVNPETGGQLMPRVKGVRKKLSAELGFLVQPVRIRDALESRSGRLSHRFNGVVRGKGEIKSRSRTRDQSRQSLRRTGRHTDQRTCFRSGRCMD